MCPMERRECIPGHSVGSRMAGSREVTHSVDSPALAVSTEEEASMGEAEGFMAAVAAMEAVATDSDVSD